MACDKDGDAEMGYHGDRMDLGVAEEPNATHDGEDSQDIDEKHASTDGQIVTLADNDAVNGTVDEAHDASEDCEDGEDSEDEDDDDDEADEDWKADEDCDEDDSE